MKIKFEKSELTKKIPAFKWSKWKLHYTRTKKIIRDTILDGDGEKYNALKDTLLILGVMRILDHYIIVEHLFDNDPLIFVKNYLRDKLK